jgi:hypothetical protein
LQPGWENAANNCHEKDMKHQPAKLKFLAIVKPQVDTTAAI